MICLLYIFGGQRGLKMIFSGYKNLFLTFSKSQKRQVWFQRSATQKGLDILKARQTTEKAVTMQVRNKKRTNNNKPHKQQQAETSSSKYKQRSNSTKQQQHSSNQQQNKRQNHCGRSKLAFQWSATCKHLQHQQQQSSKASIKQQQKMVKKTQKSNNSSANIVEGPKRQRCILHTTTAAKRPECGGQKTEKLRPRGVGPHVEVKNLQSIVKNCCQHFGRSNTAKVGEGVRRSAAQTVKAVRRRGVPRRVPEGGWPEGGGPKISRFLCLLPPPFSFFFSLSLWGSSRVFLSLSGCLLVSFFLSMGGLLVEFWWCFGRSGPPMCLFSPSSCPVKPRRPAASNNNKTWQKQHKKATKAVQTLWKVKSGKGVFFTQQQQQRGPNAGGEEGLKNRKIEAKRCGAPRGGQRAPINCEKLLSTFWKVEHCKGGGGCSMVGGPNSEGCPAEGGPAEGPRRWVAGGWRAQNLALSLPSPTSIFILFLSLWGSSRVFFSLSGGLLVSFFLSMGVFSWNFGGVLVGWDLNVLVFAFRLSFGSRRPAVGKTKSEISGGPAEGGPAE